MEDPRLEQFLGHQDRADDLRQWRLILEERLNHLRQSLTESETNPAAARKLRQQMKDLKTSLEVLRTEEAVAQFVEDSAKATLARPEPDFPPDAFDD